MPIHPTQLYSIIGNLALMLVLLRLWNMEAPWPVVSGLNLILSSTVRFIEEHYRGEPQTARWAGLAIYQWLAAGFFLAGLALLTIDAAATAAAHWLSPASVGLAFSAGLAAAFVMSVDFPRSTRRFSRLTVNAAT